MGDWGTDYMGLCTDDWLLLCSLVELCLSSNCIEEVAFHALQPLVHLRVLDLSANRLVRFTQS